MGSMPKHLIRVLLGCAALLTPALPASADSLGVKALWLHVTAAPAEGGSSGATPLRLRGADARQQLLVTGTTERGTRRGIRWSGGASAS